MEGGHDDERIEGGSKRHLATPIYWTGRHRGGPGNWHPDRRKIINVCENILAANPADDGEAIGILWERDNSVNHSSTTSKLRAALAAYQAKET